MLFALFVSRRKVLGSLRVLTYLILYEKLMMSDDIFLKFRLRFLSKWTDIIRERRLKTLWCTQGREE